MINNREQLIKAILKILSEDEYKERVEQVKEDLFHSFTEEIAKNFISPRVSDAELRQEINACLDDYFLEENKNPSAEEECKRKNYQAEIAQRFMAALNNLPNNEQNEDIKIRLYELFFSLNNYALFQTSLKECIVATLYDIAGVEIANKVMCEATKRTDMFTEQMFNENFRSEKVQDNIQGKIINFPYNS